MLWTKKELSLALACAPLHVNEGKKQSALINGFSIDSRTIKKGNCFVCIKGENQDAHSYIDQALSAGANALIVETSYLKSKPKLPKNITIFVKENSITAIQELARFHRGRFNKKAIVIGVTGSNGKTSSKEMLKGLVSAIIGEEKVFATRGNLNNHIGLPLSILQVEAQHSYIILEMGMNHSGEISLLSKLARPHHALICSIAEAHSKFFSNIDAIAKAKLEIIEGLSPSHRATNPSYLIYPSAAPGLDLAQQKSKAKNISLILFGFNNEAQNLNSTKLNNINMHSAKNLETSWDGLSFKWQGHQIYASHIYNSVLATNLLACLSLLFCLDFNIKRLVRATKKLKIYSTGRFERIQKKRKNKAAQIIVDDSYNANPASFMAAIKNFRQLMPKAKLALFMGEMAELGKSSLSSHQKLAHEAATLNYSLLGLVSGQLSTSAIESITASYKLEQESGMIFSASSSPALIEVLESSVELSTFDGILVKGSRSVRMNLIVDYIKKIDYFT